MRDLSISQVEDSIIYIYIYKILLAIFIYLVKFFLKFHFIIHFLQVVQILVQEKIKNLSATARRNLLSIIQAIVIQSNYLYLL